MKNKQTDTIMTAYVSIKIMLDSYGHRLGMLLFDNELEVKEKSNAIRAGLSYDLPKKLQFELYAFTVDTINMVPNTQSGRLLEPISLVRSDICT